MIAPRPLRFDAVVRAPGKVFLSGEYAVLWGAPACIAAVEPGVVARRTPLPVGDFDLRVPGDEVRGHWRDGRLEWESESPATRFAGRALALAVAQRGLIGMRLTFEPNATGRTRRKLGLGTSAAACTVAALAGLSREGEAPPDAAAVFRVAARAHWEVQGRRGSNGDVAASSFGGVILYERYPLERPDPPPALVIAPVSAGGLLLGMVYSGRSARTPSMVSTIEAALPVSERDAFAAESTRRTRAFTAALEGGHRATALNALNACGDVLSDLGQRAGVGIVTPELAAIQGIGRQHGIAAKVTGAGGGDGAIFASFDPAALQAALAAAEQQGYVAFPLPIAAGAVLASPGAADAT